MRSKRFIAAVLAAVTVFGYSAGYFPAGLIKPANTITADAGIKDSFAKKFDSLGYPDSTDLNTFYGYMNKYFDYDNIAYDSTTGVRSIRIKGFKTNDKQIEIPAPYYDEASGWLYSITEIGRDYSYQLSNCNYVEKLTIPYSVELIGAWSLYNAASLKEIVFSDFKYSNYGISAYVDRCDLKEIYTCAFTGCTALRKIGLSNDGRFDDLKRIKGKAFKGCTSLTEFTVPDQVETIESEAFKDSGLTDLVIDIDNSSIDTIETNVFEGTNLTTGYITKNMTTNPYENTYTLEEYVVAQDNTAGYYAEDGVLYRNYTIGNYPGNYLMRYPNAKQADSYTVPGDVSSIAGNAFYKLNNDSLSVTIPSNVSIVGNYAFNESTLKNVTVNGAPVIYDRAFYNSAITGTLAINGNARWADSESAYWFMNCDLNKVVFGPGFTFRPEVGNMAYYWKFQFFGVSTGDSEGYYSFSDNYTYEDFKAYYGNSVDTVEIQGEWGFRLSDEYWYQFGEHKFEGVKHVVFTDPDCEIGEFMFSSSPGLESVKLPANLKEIPRYAFFGTYDLKELEIPETVEKIGACAFQNTGLESLYIPYGVKSLTSSNGASYIFKTTNSEFYRTEPFTPQLRTLYIPPTLSYNELKEMEFGDYEVFNNYSFDNQTYPVTLYGVKGSGAEQYAKEHSNVTFKSMEDLNDYYVTKVDGETPVTYRHDGITYYISDTVYPPPTFTLTNGSKSYSSTSSALSCRYDGESDEIRWCDVKYADRTKGYGSKRVYFTIDPKWYTCQPGNSYSHEYNTGIVKTVPPCTEDGYDYYECIFCGDRKKISGTTVPMKGHQWGERYLAKNERYYHDCTVCGKSEMVSTVSFDKSTGVLTLKAGNISKSDVTDYKSNISVKKIVAEKGAILPADSSSIFSFCNVTTIDIKNADTSSVTDMSCMFGGCASLTSLDLSSFDTSNATDMSWMFYDCYSLTSLDLSSFDTSNVINMSEMFNGCSSLTSLDLSSFDTSKVTNMNNMFYNCSSLTSVDLSSFDTRNVTNMGKMFRFSIELKTILVSDKWNTDKVESSEAMFAYCDKLVGGNGTVFDEGIVGATYARIDKAGDPGYLTENTLYNVAFKHNCSFQNDLSMYYAVPKSSLAGFSNIRLDVSKEEYTAGAEKPTIVKRTITSYKEQTIGGVVYYMFTFDGITSTDMGSTLSASILADKNGVTYSSKTDKYSIKDYAMDRLRNSNNATFKKMLVDMLNYGAAAQVHFDKNTSNLVNKDLTAAQKAMGTQTLPTLKNAEKSTAVSGATATFDKKNVSFENKTVLMYRLKFAANQNMSNVKLNISYKTSSGASVTKTIPASQFTKSGSYHIASIDSIAITDVRSVITAKIYDGSKQISNTFQYSIESYVYNRLQNSDSETFKNLVTEMMKFGISAEEHFS